MRPQGERARLAREQRPRFVTGPAATSGVPARHGSWTPRARLCWRTRAAGGRRELRGPIQAWTASRSAQRGRHRRRDSTELRYGRYACIAVTARFEGERATVRRAPGQAYRVRIDFDTGRYAFCKVAGRPGEGQLKRHWA